MPCFNYITSVKPVVKLCNTLIGVVDDDLHLGNRLYNNIYQRNHTTLGSDFYRSSNNVIANRMCDKFICTLRTVLAFMVLSHVTLVENIVDDIYIAWRKVIRVIFKIPNVTHNYIVFNLCYSITDGLDRRLVKYIHSLSHTNNTTEQSIVNSKLLICL